MSSENADSNIAIELTKVSKSYFTYENPQDRLKQSIYPPLRRALGLKERAYYREFTSLRDISFSVKRGETLGVIGQNGAGKSTLLQIICGTLSQSEGRVETHGRVAALLELGSGFNPEFTGRENIYMNAMILGLSQQEIDEKYDAITAFADIGDFINQPVKTYSSGMVLRVAFSVIAHVDADILVVDEALSVGDAFFVQRCMRFLRKFMETGTVLFVSHDTGAVVNLCDRVILLKDGQIFQSGTPKDVVKKYLELSYVNGDDTTEDDDKTNNVTSVNVDEPEDEYVDARHAFINSSEYRNDIELFAFDPDSEGFGQGGAKVTSTRLVTETGQPASWLVGGEMVGLEVDCVAKEAISSPIIGFILKDRLGQVVFGDNTFLTYQHAPLSLKAGQKLHAKFAFRLPILPTGDYSVSIAIAEGTQDNHIQHAWLHEALIMKVHASSVVFGLFGVPMKKIEMYLS